MADIDNDRVDDLLDHHIETLLGYKRALRRITAALDIIHAWRGGRMHATANDVIDGVEAALKGES